jgi:hypothetical protein
MASVERVVSGQGCEWSGRGERRAASPFALGDVDPDCWAVNRYAGRWKF